MDADAPESRPPHGPPAAPAASIGAAVRATSLVTLASRVGGLARDLLVGLMFRDTALGTAFANAFAIPNLFRRLFGEGALSAAFIPEYTRALKTDRAAAGRLASLTILWLGIATSLLTVLGELVLLVLLFTLPRDPDRETAIGLTMTMLPFMPLICAAAVMSGMLQVHGRFGPAASGPLILNAFIIGVGLWFVLRHEVAGTGAAYAIGVATTLSGGSQVWWFVRLLRADVAWTRATAPARPAARAMLGRFIPVMIGAGTLQLNALMDIAIASYTLWVGPTLLGRPYPLDDTSGSILALTSRLYQFPLGVFGIAVASAIFPLLSRHADEPTAFIHTLRRGVRLSLFIALPASIGLILVRHDAVAVLVPTYSAVGKLRCADVLLGFAPGVWAYSLNHVLTRAFYALGDTRTPMRIALAMVAVNFALNITLIWWLREAGLAWSTSISAVLQTVVLWNVLGRRLRRAPGPHDPAAEPHAWNAETTAAVLRLIALGAAMAAAVLALLWAWPIDPAAAAWTDRAGALWRSQGLRALAATALGAAVYGGGALAWRLQELHWLLPRARAR
ncbi:murein biosynthesis integral membrane protein MurJ [soil metagenome]